MGVRGRDLNADQSPQRMFISLSIPWRPIFPSLGESLERGILRGAPFRGTECARLLLPTLVLSSSLSSAGAQLAWPSVPHRPTEDTVAAKGRGFTKASSLPPGLTRTLGSCR